MKTGRAGKILIARTDRLGDVLMTLPSLRFLSTTLGEGSIDFLCRRELHDILAPTLATWNIQTVDFKHRSYREARESLSTNYGSVLFFYANAALHWAAWRNRVPRRVGL